MAPHLETFRQYQAHLATQGIDTSTTTWDYWEAARRSRQLQGAGSTQSTPMPTLTANTIQPPPQVYAPGQNYFAIANRTAPSVQQPADTPQLAWMPSPVTHTAQSSQDYTQTQTLPLTSAVPTMTAQSQTTSTNQRYRHIQPMPQPNRHFNSPAGSTQLVDQYHTAYPAASNRAPNHTSDGNVQQLFNQPMGSAGPQAADLQPQFSFHRQLSFTTASNDGEYGGVDETPFTQTPAARSQETTGGESADEMTTNIPSLSFYTPSGLTSKAMTPSNLSDHRSEIEPDFASSDAVVNFAAFSPLADPDESMLPYCNCGAGHGQHLYACPLFGKVLSSPYW